jgi:hypothetical protein
VLDGQNEIRKVLGHPGIVFTDPVRVTTQQLSGRAFAHGGDRAKAKAAYKDFLTLWKDADSDVPILKEGRLNI